MLVAPGAKPTPSTVRTASKAAPIAGLNTADLVTTVSAKGQATRLDNFLCRRKGLTTRAGWSVAQTVSGAVTALIAHEGQVLARTDGDWMAATVANPGGRHTLAMTGAGAPQRYSGATWATVAATGVDATKLCCPVLHGKRLFAIESGTATIWYLGESAIGGPAYPIFAAPLLTRGGALTAIASMTGDGGKGGPDSLVAVSEHGEMVVYAGLDPSHKESFALVGVFDVPRPVGRRCFAGMGAGLSILTELGLLPVPKVLAAQQSGKSVVALSADVEPTIMAMQPRAVIESGFATVTLVDGGDGTQLVRDPDTGGWSRWLGMGATCWLEGRDGLYFGRADGRIGRYGAEDDDGAAIGAVMVDGFAELGTRRRKRFSRIRPQFELAHPYNARLSLVMDYREPPASWAAAHTTSRYRYWPEVTWPMQPAQWTKPVSSRMSAWRGVSGEGTVAAAILGLTCRDPGVVYIGSDFAFETGGSL